MDTPQARDWTDGYARVCSMHMDIAHVRMLLLRLVGLIDQREATLQQLEELVTRMQTLVGDTACPVTELRGARAELCALVQGEAALQRQIGGLLCGANLRLDALRTALPPWLQQDPSGSLRVDA